MATDDELKCLECGVSVLSTGLSSATGIGNPPTFQPARSHTECPECGAKLVRQVDPSGPWRLQT